jgi:hypothetical protein
MPKNLRTFFAFTELQGLVIEIVCNGIGSVDERFTPFELVAVLISDSQWQLYKKLSKP